MLARVFTLSVNSYQTYQARHCSKDLSVSQLTAITSVCSYWRQIALDASTLWSYIDCEMLHCLDLASLWLDRARDCPLDIVTRGPPCRTQFSRSSFESILPRIRCLRSMNARADLESAAS